MSTTYPAPGAPVDDENCMLLGPTALVVQAIMGVLVLLSLVYKRHREKPMRPWRIWTFDVSKQILGQAVIHLLNIGISGWVSRPSTGNNPCTAYFMNVTFDVTVGVLIIWACLHGSTYLLTKKLGFNGFTSGSYGNPPSLSYWGRQASIYVLAVVIMKLGVLALLSAVPSLLDIGEWLLSWTGDNSHVQIIFVMGVYPVVMNILQFWLIDSIVKATAYIEALEAANREGEAETAATQPLVDGADDSDESDGEDAIGQKKSHLDIESQGTQTAGSGTSTDNTRSRQHSSSSSSQPRSSKPGSVSSRSRNAKGVASPPPPAEDHDYPPPRSPTASHLSRQSIRKRSLPPSPSPSVTPLYGSNGESPRMRTPGLASDAVTGWEWEESGQKGASGLSPTKSTKASMDHHKETWKLPVVSH